MRPSIELKPAAFLACDHPHVIREAIMCCRKGGTLSFPGLYIGYLDTVPFWRRDEQRPDDKNGPDERTEVHGAAAEKLKLAKSIRPL